jgi:hypothetical protein
MLCYDTRVNWRLERMKTREIGLPVSFAVEIFKYRDFQLSIVIFAHLNYKITKLHREIPATNLKLFRLTFSDRGD